MRKLAFAMIGVFFYTTSIIYAYPSQPVVNKPPTAIQFKNKQTLQNAILVFTENKGQVVDAKGNARPDVLFTAYSGGAKIYITSKSIHYEFVKQNTPNDYKTDGNNIEELHLRNDKQEEKQIETYHFNISLQGSNPSPVIRKEQQGDFTENFYLAHCPNGITGVHTFSKIVLAEVYPGIDWVIYSKAEGLEYDFVVHAGANPAKIQLKVNDAQSVKLNKQGEMVIKTSLGEVKEKAPVSFCEGKKISTAFTISKNGIVSFKLGGWNRNKDLTVDPSVSWATYYGGGYGYSTAVDNFGNIYSAGYTGLSTGIALNGYQNTYNGDYDGYLVKFNSNGTRLWATYYGGIGNERSYSCAIDHNGNVYLALETSSIGLAYNGFQSNNNGGNCDALLVKFDSNGLRLWATYYGGNGVDACTDCAVDANNNVYLSGFTNATTGIAYNGFQNVYAGGSYDAFVVKFNSNGERLWATYCGGNDNDYFNFCTVDNTGNVYLAGWTYSTTGISVNGYQNTIGGGIDAFLIKLSGAGGRLWATYYGSFGRDYGFTCATDAQSNVYLGGHTGSQSGITTPDAYQSVHAGGNFDAFLVKFSANGVRLWGTYYGGSANTMSMNEQGNSCATDVNGNVYFVGFTNSVLGISFNGMQNTYGGGSCDGFIIKFNSNGVRQWSSYYGGTGTDGIYDCAINGSGIVYLAGHTSSTNGIAFNGYQNTYSNTGLDAFFVRVNDNNPLPVKLLQFAASNVNANRNQVNWRTATESTGTRFEIERSKDGRTFSTIAKATGVSLNGAVYTIYDDAPIIPVSHYRLKLIEPNGTSSYSSIVEVKILSANFLTVAPVPSKTDITVRNTNALINGSKAIITDMQGKEMHHFVVNNITHIDISRWAAGVYNLRVEDGSVLRILKQ